MQRRTRPRPGPLVRLSPLTFNPTPINTLQRQHEQLRHHEAEAEENRQATAALALLRARYGFRPLSKPRLPNISRRLSPHVMTLPSSAPSPDRADARTTHPDPGATSWRLTSRTSTSLTTRALTASSRSGESSRTRPTMKRRTWARRTTWWWSPTARRTASRESTTVRRRRCSAHSRGQPLQVLDAMASSIVFAAASR